MRRGVGFEVPFPDQDAGFTDGIGGVQTIEPEHLGGFHIDALGWPVPATVELADQILGDVLRDVASDATDSTERVAGLDGFDLDVSRRVGAAKDSSYPPAVSGFKGHVPEATEDVERGSTAVCNVEVKVLTVGVWFWDCDVLEIYPCHAHRPGEVTPCDQEFIQAEYFTSCECHQGGRSKLDDCQSHPGFGTTLGAFNGFRVTFPGWLTTRGRAKAGGLARVVGVFVPLHIRVECDPLDGDFRGDRRKPLDLDPVLLGVGVPVVDGL